MRTSTGVDAPRGFAVAFGILLDTIVVQSVQVTPATAVAMAALTAAALVMAGCPPRPGSLQVPV